MGMKTERAARQGGPQTDYQHRRYTKASPEIQDRSRELAGRRSEWMCKVIRSPLLNSAGKLTLIRLALYFRGGSKTRAPSYKAWPSHEKLARQRRVCARTIRRHLEKAEEVGFIFIEGREGGVWSDDGELRGQTNHYYLALPDGMSLDDDDDGYHADDGDDDYNHDAGDVDAGVEEANLDTDDQVWPKPDTDAHFSASKPGQSEQQTRTDLNANLDSCCPINPSTENPSKESFNQKAIDPSSATSLNGFIGQNAHDAKNDEPFPPVPDREEAYAFILRLFGEGDDARGKRIDQATWMGTRLKYKAVDGELRPSMIEEAIKSYGKKMTWLAPMGLRALQIALDEKGNPAEASDHIPRNARVVQIDDWCSCFCRLDHARSDAWQKCDFRSASDYLIDEGIVMVFGGQAWLSPATETPDLARGLHTGRAALRGRGHTLRSPETACFGCRRSRR